MMIILIIFGIFGALLVGIFVICDIKEKQEKEKELLRTTYRDMKNGDKYSIKGVVDPFNISDKQIAVIVNKDISPEDNQYYVQFICDNIKYSSSLKNFLKEWNEISSSSLLNKIKIDTDFGIKQKYFGDLDIDEIRKKSNNNNISR